MNNSTLRRSLMPAPPDLAGSDGPLASAMPQGMPQMAPGAAPNAPPQEGPPQQPAPSHEQTVAALRHFQALLAEGRTLLKNPDLGKSNVKSAIQDGAIKLVADGIISPADAVTQLATVPERPIEQKKWVENLYAQAVTAQSNVLDHHRMAHIGTGDYGIESALHQSNPDAHKQTMQGMMEAHYGGGRG
jgi:hypothetical protein